MAQWLSWLERRPVTAKVESSSLFWVVSNELTSLVNCIWIWNLSSAGRASALQAEGHRFEPYSFHQRKTACTFWSAGGFAVLVSVRKMERHMHVGVVFTSVGVVQGRGKRAVRQQIFLQITY